MKQIPFLQYRLLFALISVAVVVLSIVLVGTKGLNFDTDFTGGRKLLYQFNTSVSEKDLRGALDSKGIHDVTVRQYGELGENRFIVKAGLLPEGVESTVDPITQAIQGAFGADKVVLQQEESVGPKAGKELRRKAQVAILVSCFLILIYIGFRFDFMFSPGAIVALIHDIIITLGAIALVQSNFSLTSVAALLTILGYSINDTIVLYDRIRENTTKHLGESTDAVINLSINQVLSRTLITSITILFVVVVLFVVAEGAIRDFAFAMIVGVIAGTYSSIFVASPVYLVMHRWAPLMGGEKAS